MLKNNGFLPGTNSRHLRAVRNRAFNKLCGILTVLMLLAATVHAQVPGIQPKEQASITQPADKALLEASGLNERIREARAVLKKAEAEQWLGFLQEMARKNVSYSKDLDAVNSSASKVEDNISRLKEKLAEVKGNYERTRKRMKSMGLTSTAGVFFERRLRALSRLRAPTRAGDTRRREIRRIAKEELIIEDLQVEVSCLDTEELHRRLADLNLPPEREKELEQQSEQLVRQTKKLLNEISVAYPKYLALLADEGYAERALRLEVNSYINLLRAQLLWTRSNQAFSGADVLFVGRALPRLFSPWNWHNFISDLIASVKRSPSGWAVWLLLALIWAVACPRLAGRIRNLNSRAASTGDDSILPTARALGLAVIHEGGLPLLVYFAARQLWMFPGSQVFTRSVCAGLIASAKILFWAGLAIETFGPGGIGRAHFHWPEAVCRAIGRCARQVMLFVVPLVFFMIILNTGMSAAERGSLGRFVFMAMMIVFAVILSPLFRSGSPVMSLPAFLRSRGLCAKMSRLFLPAAVTIPLLLLIFAWQGYYHSVIGIGGAFLRTIALLLALVFIKAFMVRWWQLFQQRIDLREKKPGVQTATDDPPAGGSTEPAEQGKAASQREGAHSDQADFSKEASLLIRLVVMALALAGLYVIWGMSVPVLQILNEIILWTYQLGLGASQQLLIKPVTLGNLILCFVILWLTALISKNISGFLNAIVFRRLKTDPANRHALGLISRYAVIILGVILAMNKIGIGWAKVQWLVAALTVGLGFGLQDIVANFVAGIIILFEKPIRIGDTVTMLGTSGKVTRIQIRSTTITDWDRRETIIPNKSFLTDKIVNWSLTDPIIRIVIEVGIAYGSDTARAEELLLKTAGENPLVMNDPAPSVVFFNFGDNSLDFKLRAFIHTKDRILATHQLHLAINEAFNRAGIEIPFPQRDTHLDAPRPLDVRIIKETPGSTPPEQEG